MNEEIEQLKKEVEENIKNGKYRHIYPIISAAIGKVDELAAHVFKEIYKVVLIEADKNLNLQLSEEGKRNKQDQMIIDSVMEAALCHFCAFTKAHVISSGVLHGVSMNDAEKVFDFIVESKYLEQIQEITKQLKKMEQ